MDDSLLNSNTEDGLLDVMRRFFTRMRLFGLYLKLTKCHVKKEITWLGHRISADGVAVDPDKVKYLEAIRDPQNAAELQQYLAMLLWLKGRLPGYNAVTKPMQDALNCVLKGTSRNKTAGKKVQLNTIGWGLLEEKIFMESKQLLRNAVMVAHVNHDMHMGLFCDASDTG